MNRLNDPVYWAWVGFVTLATCWGGFAYAAKVGFWWSMGGAVVLLLIVGLLRRWDVRRALSASSDPKPDAQ